jgi:hypothetical protein
MDPMKTAAGRLLLLTLIAAQLGCPRKSAIWLEGAAGPGQPIFGVGRTVAGRAEQLSFFVVARCGPDVLSNTLWAFHTDSGATKLSKITYGQVPLGYRASSSNTSTLSVAPLPAGCYVARDDGIGRIEFSIDSLGAPHAR